MLKTGCNYSSIEFYVRAVLLSCEGLLKLVWQNSPNFWLDLWPLSLIYYHDLCHHTLVLKIKTSECVKYKKKAWYYKLLLMLFRQGSYIVKRNGKGNGRACWSYPHLNPDSQVFRGIHLKDCTAPGLHNELCFKHFIWIVFSYALTGNFFLLLKSLAIERPIVKVFASPLLRLTLPPPYYFSF